MRQFLILLGVLIMLDGLWLGLLMRDFYREGPCGLASWIAAAAGRTS